MEKKSKYPVVAVTSKSVELEVRLLRMKYLVQELFSGLCRALHKWQKKVL